MRNLSTKVNRDLLTPGEFNSFIDELENIVTTTGGTLDGAGGPDDDLNMLGQAAATYGSAGDFYEHTISGTDNILLSRESNLEEPQSYMAGLKVIFKSTFTNTGATTVNVASLGIKDLTDPDGTAVSSGTITPNVYYTAIFNNTDNRFELTHNTKLTDNSIADTLHRHSELVASDGSPDPALSVDVDGKIMIGTGSPTEKLEVHPDTDISGIIGKAHIGHMTHADYAGFSHVDQNGANTYCLLHGPNGNTYLNAADGQQIIVKINNTNIITFSTGGITFAASKTIAFNLGTSINEFSIDGTLAGDSDDAVPTEKAVKTYVDGNINAPSYVKVSDVKSSGSNGGTFTQDAWQTRTLNTEDSDTAGICTLSSNQITLAAGTYECNITAPAYQVLHHKAKLRNVTDSADLLIGTSEYAYTTGTVTNRSFVVGKFTVGASKALEVQHYCGNTNVTQGFGLACTFGVDEVYTVAEFRKVG